jgi:hypothetical protein
MAKIQTCDKIIGMCHFNDYGNSVHISTLKNAMCDI